MNFRNRLIISACIGVIFAALSWLDIGAHLEELSIDLRLRHRPARECAAPVRLVVVDDDDIAEFGQWPIPRAGRCSLPRIL
jgi:CHASE2 domain-containing sensor protein